MAVMLSVGIVAGFVSGFLYLVIRYMGKLRSTVQGDGEDAQCHRCESSHRRCSVCIKHREVRLQAGDWFYRQLQDRFCRNKNNNNNNLSDTGIENGVAMDPDSTQVREFIERLVESLVSGSLDDVKVNRLYSHPEYDRMFACHHSALCETLVRLSFALQMSIANKPVPEQDSPSAVHTTLKQRVHDIVEEAMTLPNLKTEASSQNKWDEDITSMSYEDILATAILNKVIERFQQRTGLVLRDDNSNVMEPPSKYISSIEIGVTGPSSLDDGETSSHSWSESSHTEPSSMMIEERIEEEVTTYNSDGEAGEETRPASELDFYLSGLNFIKPHRVPFPELGVDIVDDDEDDNEECGSPQPTDLVSPVDSWEENWLFQRRRLKMGGSTQQNPMPVPMLVPNPSEEYRALIGDRDAEEVSDLSDCSDGALEDMVSGMSQQAEEDTDAVVPALDTELVKAPSVESLSQQDSEYTEDYAAVAQRQPVPTPRSSVPQPREEETQEVSEDAMLATPPRPGTIAEREHRKWQSAVPLPNNPYSPENISKRLSKKSELFSYSTAPKSLPDVMLTIAPTPLPTSPEPDYNKYGRDYYINESKKSSGSRHSSPQKSSDAAETEHDSGVDTNDTSQPYNLVENEVARWQKGIEQTERQWLSKLATKQTSPINSTSRTSSTNSLAHPDGPANAASIPAKKPTPRQREDATRDWSECSTVSSDLDQDADVPIALPSVKELAKHFSAGVTSDSDTSVSKVAPLTRQKVDVQKSMAEVPTTALKREIHSLTARSISREFREGLRRNLHSKQDSVSSSPELDDKKQTAVVHDTTPGYTSDESGTRSPTPPFGGRRRLQNNIAFWEQMSGK